MRLTAHEQNSIRQCVAEKDPNAKIYLFGSRADDSKRGGDIDLLILSNKVSVSDKIDIKLALFDRIGERKIDIVIAPDTSRAFTRIAMETGVAL
jgi:uncharacterized protein